MNSICFFCEREPADLNSKVLVQLMENPPRESDPNKRVRLLLPVPRCEKCKSLHERANIKAGRRWAIRHLLACLITLAFSASCVFLVEWLAFNNSDFRIENDFSPSVSISLAIAFFLYCGFFGAITDLTFKRKRIMTRLLKGVKAPDEYNSFQPLVERLQGDWNAKISAHDMYGNWYYCYEAISGFTDNNGTNPSRTDHCFEKQEKGVVHILEIENTGT